MTCVYPHRCPNRAEVTTWADGENRRWMCGCQDDAARLSDAPDTTAAGPGAALAGTDSVTDQCSAACSEQHTYAYGCAMDRLGGYDPALDAWFADLSRRNEEATRLSQCAQGLLWHEGRNCVCKTTEDGDPPCRSVSPRPSLMEWLCRKVFRLLPRIRD